VFDTHTFTLEIIFTPIAFKIAAALLLAHNQPVVEFCIIVEVFQVKGHLLVVTPGVTS